MDKKLTLEDLQKLSEEELKALPRELLEQVLDEYLLSEQETEGTRIDNFLGENFLTNEEIYFEYQQKFIREAIIKGLVGDDLYNYVEKKLEKLKQL